MANEYSVIKTETRIILNPHIVVVVIFNMGNITGSNMCSGASSDVYGSSLYIIPNCLFKARIPDPFQCTKGIAAADLDNVKVKPQEVLGYGIIKNKYIFL